MDRGKKDNKRMKKTINQKQSDLIEDLKMEIASELGIIEQVENNGWQSLSPKISGKIGGRLSQRLRKMSK
jgi:hypothetical protein